MAEELILKINVQCKEALCTKGHGMTVVMIPFTGNAEGKFFTGKVIGTGTDTQKISPGGVCRLSARYMLSGRDFKGEECQIFIENETHSDGSLRPLIVTDSAALADWETASLRSDVTPCEGGVVVNIYRVNDHPHNHHKTHNDYERYNP